MERKPFRITILTLICLFIPLNLAAQQYNFIHYSVDNGLAGSFVNVLLQDSKGYLWIGTVNGLSRFDGVTFENFYKEDALPGNFIKKIFEDSKGRIWVSILNAGIGYYRYGSFHTVMAQNTFSVYEPLEDSQGHVLFSSRGIVYSYENDSLSTLNLGKGWESKEKNLLLLNYIDGKLWINSLEGLHIYDGRKMIPFHRANGFPDLTPTRLIRVYQGKTGQIWMASERELLHYDGVNWRSYPFPKSDKPFTPLSIIEDLDGKVLIGTSRGIFKFNGKHIETLKYKNRPIKSKINAMLLDHHGNIWLGTPRGLFLYKDDGFRRFTTSDGLVNQQISALLEDREGNIWIGTSSVLTVLKSPEIQVFNQSSGIVENLVWGIAEDHNGGIWIGTNSGLNYWDGNEISTVKGNGLLENVRCISIAVDSSHNVWVGKGDGVLKYDGKRWTPVLQDMVKMVVNAIYEAKNKDLLIAVRNTGLIRIRQGKTTLFQAMADSGRRVSFVSVTQDPDQQLVMGTSNGVWFFNEEKQEPEKLTLNQPIDNDYVFSVFFDSKHTMWACTRNGIYSASRDKITCYSTKEGLSDNQCYYAREDMDGNIWIGTNNGLNKFNGTHFTALTSLTGLSSSEMNMGSVLLDSKHNLWVGTINGLSRIDLSMNLERKIAPNIDLLGMTVNEKEFPVYSSHTLRYNQNNITCSYNGIQLYSPDQVEYQVKLSGYQDEWTTTNELEVSYHNLPPGQYVFMVRAQNTFDHAQSDIRSVHFTINPRPFLLNPWLWVSTLLLLGFSHAFFYFRARKQLKTQKQIFQELIKERESSEESIKAVKDISHNTKKYSNLTQEEADYELARFLNLMQKQKLYTKAGLDIKQTADELNISPRNLSEIINRELKQRFSNLINQYRVEEAKERICKMDKKELNLLSIAFDVGFNSKSSFNAIFKKYTGLTPSEFYKKYREAEI